MIRLSSKDSSEKKHKQRSALNSSSITSYLHRLYPWRHQPKGRPPMQTAKNDKYSRVITPYTTRGERENETERRRDNIAKYYWSLCKLKSNILISRSPRLNWKLNNKRKTGKAKELERARGEMKIGMRPQRIYTNTHTHTDIRCCTLFTISLSPRKT